MPPVMVEAKENHDENKVLSIVTENRIKKSTK